MTWLLGSLPVLALLFVTGILKGRPAQSRPHRIAFHGGLIGLLSLACLPYCVIAGVMNAFLTTGLPLSLVLFVVNIVSLFCAVLATLWALLRMARLPPQVHTRKGEFAS